jgi:hypothetical protein
MNKNQLELIGEICRQNGITYLGLFGSFARGDYNDQSDADLLVEYGPNSPVKSLFDLPELEGKFEHVLGRRVDLVSRKHLNPRIKNHVYRDLKVLYEGQ